MNELISIITPSFNSSRFISQTIDSVLSQNYDKWEMIIVDDASEDKSNKIIEEYIKKDSRIKLIKLKINSGPSEARNRAIEIAKGRYIAFLDADDVWFPEKLKKQISFMEEYKLSFTYTSYNIINEQNEYMDVFKVKETIDYSSMLKSCSVGCLTAIYDTNILGKLFMPIISKRQDYGLWLMILKKIKTTKGIVEPLASYRIHKNSLSFNKLKASRYQWKIYREIEKLSLLSSAYYFIHYAYAGIKKHNIKGR